MLLAVLASVSDSDTQLSRLDFLDIPEGDVTPSAADKKQRLEEWANFPLRTREDVLRWREGRVSRGSHSRGVERLMDPSSEGDVGQDVGGMGVDADGNDSFEHGAGEGCMETVVSVPPQDQNQAHGFENWFPPVQERRHHSTLSARSPISGQARGVLGLSKEFQDTFLW